MWFWNCVSHAQCFSIAMYISLTYCLVLALHSATTTIQSTVTPHYLSLLYVWCSYFTYVYHLTYIRLFRFVSIAQLARGRNEELLCLCWEYKFKYSHSAPCIWFSQKSNDDRRFNQITGQRCWIVDARRDVMIIYNIRIWSRLSSDFGYFISKHENI